MKKSNNTIIWVIVSAVFLCGLVWVIWYLMPKDKFNWNESYRINDKEPYGGYVIGELLKKDQKKKDFNIIQKRSLHETLDTNKVSPDSKYIFIGGALYLDSADIQSMLSFVRSGHDAFISSEELPSDLTVNLKEFQCYWHGYTYRSDSIARMNFYHPDLVAKNSYPYSFIQKDEIISYSWAGFNTSNICENSYEFTKLGYFKTKYDSETVNFVCIPYGSGNFYFHTTPLVFTNYFLLNDRALDYAAKTFSHLKPGNIYWDEFSRNYHYNGDDGNGGGRESESPLQFLLEQKSMRWAWFTLLFGVVLMYLLFRTKRRQRVIPLLEPNTNTSLEFVQTIGRLYFLQNNHRGLCKQMMRHYLAFVRNKYSLSTLKINEELFSKIASRSKVNIETIRNIFNSFGLIDKTAAEINDKELINFHQSIDSFYKNCK